MPAEADQGNDRIIDDNEAESDLTSMLIIDQFALQRYVLACCQVRRARVLPAVVVSVVCIHFYICVYVCVCVCVYVCLCDIALGRQRWSL